MEWETNPNIQRTASPWGNVNTDVEEHSPSIQRSAPTWDNTPGIVSGVSGRPPEVSIGGWSGLEGAMEPTSIRFFKGVNKLDKFSIADEYSPSSKNVTSANYPRLSVRSGWSMVGTTLGLTGLMTGMFVWKEKELHTVKNGTWRKWNGTNWIIGPTSLSTTAEWSTCNFKGSYTDFTLLAVNGVDTPRKYDGTTWSTLAGVPAEAKFIDQHDNRVYYAKGNTIAYSALRKAEDWTTVEEAGEIVIEEQSGDIVGIKAGTGHVVVFFPNAIYELWGNRPANFQMQPVSDVVGAVSNKAIVNIRGTIYFVDREAIYRYSGSTSPTEKFAIPVEYYIQNINPAYRHLVAAGTDGKNLYISLPLGTATQNNVVLEYSPDYDIWNVWEDINATHFAEVGTDWFAASNAGPVMKMGGAVQDGTVPISWRWESKPFAGGSMAQQLRWYKLWYAANVPAGSTLNVYLSKSADLNDWQLVKSVASTALQTGRINLSVANLVDAHWLRIKFEGTGPCDIHEITRQQRQLPL
jgi:hypothetical protein